MAARTLKTRPAPTTANTAADAPLNVPAAVRPAADPQPQLAGIKVGQLLAEEAGVAAEQELDQSQAVTLAPAVILPAELLDSESQVLTLQNEIEILGRQTVATIFLQGSALVKIRDYLKPKKKWMNWLDYRFPNKTDTINRTVSLYDGVVKNMPTATFEERLKAVSVFDTKIEAIQEFCPARKSTKKKSAVQKILVSLSGMDKTIKKMTDENKKKVAEKLTALLALCN